MEECEWGDFPTSVSPGASVRIRVGPRSSAAAGCVGVAVGLSRQDREVCRSARSSYLQMGTPRPREAGNPVPGLICSKEQGYDLDPDGLSLSLSL